MTLGRLWAGRAFGTNIGNLFLKLDGEDTALKGMLHFNEAGVGIVVYAVSGSFDGNRLSIHGVPATQIEGVTFGQLMAEALLDQKGQFSGQWHTTIGSAGTFVLFPHDQSQTSETVLSKIPDQLHTARYHVGAVEIDRLQITALADEIQRDFKNNVVVTVVADTEQSRFLPEFKTLSFGAEKPKILKLYAQEPEASGVNRVASVEFGPQVNMLMTQGVDEAWVLGILEKLKRNIKPLERTYITNFKKMGFGVNQLLVFGAIVFLPSLDTWQDRAIFMGGILSLAFLINWFHQRYLPFAAIYLGNKSTGLLARFAPSALSWIIGIAASVAAALLGAYLKGVLNLHG